MASQMHLPRDTVAKWWHRYRAEGEAGLRDRSSRLHRTPRRTDSNVE
ncbi:helix-turn-helix domain-containing protein [Candidatus Poriferisodalis sp.]